MTEDRLSEEALAEIREMAAKEARKIAEEGNKGGLIADMDVTDELWKIRKIDAKGERVFVKRSVTPSEQ